MQSKSKLNISNNKMGIVYSIVTLNTENNNKLSELLSNGFERNVVWNEYKSKLEGVTIPQNNNMFRSTTLDASFQGVSKLFAAAYETDDIERNANTEESPPRWNSP